MFERTRFELETPPLWWERAWKGRLGLMTGAQKVLEGECPYSNHGALGWIGWCFRCKAFWAAESDGQTAILVYGRARQIRKVPERDDA